MAWPGRSCFGFVAPLNEPHAARCVSRGGRRLPRRSDIAGFRGDDLGLSPAGGHCASAGLSPGLVIARVLGLSQALLRADASLRPSSLHDFSSMTKKDCHFVEAAEKAVIL